MRSLMLPQGLIETKYGARAKSHLPNRVGAHASEKICANGLLLSFHQHPISLATESPVSDHGIDWQHTLPYKKLKPLIRLFNSSCFLAFASCQVVP